MGVIFTQDLITKHRGQYSEIEVCTVMHFPDGKVAICRTTSVAEYASYYWNYKVVPQPSVNVAVGEYKRLIGVYKDTYGAVIEQGII